jgi:hypothetical protein
MVHRFNFPRVEDLTLKGSFDKVIWKRLSVPSLKTLRLLDARLFSGIISNPLRCPNLARLHLAAEETYSDAKSLIKIFPHVHELAFVGDRELVSDSMRAMKGLQPVVKGYELIHHHSWERELESYENAPFYELDESLEGVD